MLATNDFHGRLLDDPASAAAGAASMAGAVKQLRAENPDTVFAMAGDIIGASTFESFIANDKPTIDAMNEAGLEVSAAGNHEFDQGYRDLLDRVMAPRPTPRVAPTGSTSPPTSAWTTATGQRAATTRWRLPRAETPTARPGGSSCRGGRTVGFVGAMTEDLPSLVAPDGSPRS